VPECLIREDWIGILEVVLVESMVDSFLIALDISPVWPRQAPAHKHLPLVVLMDDGGHHHYQLQVTI
jgi:hypothetical protein